MSVAVALRAVDPVVTGVGIGFLASVVVGRAAIYGLELAPAEWRRAMLWALIAGAGVLAIVGALWPEGSGSRAVLAFVIAALPGTIAYLVFRTVFASAVVSLLPLYFVINSVSPPRAMHMPAIALDRIVPVGPGWMVVYGSLYMFVLLPVVVVRSHELFRRTMQAYLAVMLVAFAGFLAYPTIAPRPSTVVADGFFAWCLRLTYSLDTPYNCFPSLHVANSFVSALACYRVHRNLGIAAAIWAALIGVSTLFTKQHFVIDVIAGALMAYAAYLLFLRRYPRSAVDPVDARLAPRRALAAVAMYAAMLICFWIMYRTGVDAG